MYNNVYKVKQEMNNIVKCKYKIACFCLDKWLVSGKGYDCIERGFARSRMWAQYASNHQGVCLAFSKAKIIEALQNPKESTIKYLDGEMEYVKQPNISGINARSLSVNKIQELGKEKYVEEHIKNNWCSFFLQKNDDFRDEREYRIMIYEETEEYFNLPIHNCLVGVIVGDKFPDVYCGIIKQYADEEEIECFRLKWHNEKPRLSKL